MMEWVWAAANVAVENGESTSGLPISDSSFCLLVVVILGVTVALIFSGAKQSKCSKDATCQRCCDAGYTKRWVETGGRSSHMTTDFCSCPYGQQLKGHYKGR